MTLDEQKAAYNTVRIIGPLASVITQEHIASGGFSLVFGIMVQSILQRQPNQQEKC